jgi:hypothetical protein
VGDVLSKDEVRFALTRAEPGGSCAHNFISVPLHRDDLADADALAADIGGVYMVNRYNAATQDLTWRMPGVSGENFSVRAGYPYIVCLDETAPMGDSQSGMAEREGRNEGASVFYHWFCCGNGPFYAGCGGTGTRGLGP